MKTNQEKSKSLFKTYKGIEPYLKHIVNILSVVYEPCTCFKYLQLIPKGDKYYANLNMMKKLFGLLEDKGLLIRNQQTYSVAPEIREMVMAEFASEKEFAAIADMVKVHCNSNDWHPYAIIRNFRIALYLQQEDAIYEIFEIILFNDEAMYSIFNSPFSINRIRLLPDEEMQLEVCIRILFYNIINGNVLNEELKKTILDNIFKIGIEEEKILDILLYLKFTDSDLPQIPEYFKQTAFYSIYEAIELILKGDKEKGESALLNNKELFFAEDDEGVISGFSSLFFVTSLINKRDNDGLKKIVNMTRHLGESFLISGSFRLLNILSRVYMGEVAINNSLLRHFNFNENYNSSIFGKFVNLLCLYWFDSPSFNRDVNFFEDSCIGNETTPFYSKQLKLLKRGEGFSALLKPIERWEGALNGLLGLFKNNEQVNHSMKKERLMWRVKIDNNNIDLIPLIQKMGKNGKWSKGRQVQFRDVIYDMKNDSLDFLPVDKDIVILGKSAEEMYWSASYEKRETRIKILKLAIGHPRLLANNSIRSIEFKEIKPVLKTVCTDTDITLELIPSVSSKDEVAVLKFDDYIGIAFINDKLHQVSAFLGDQLKIPMGQSARVYNLIAALEEVVEVEGDTEHLTKDFSVIESKNVIQFFVEPLGGGLLFYVRATIGEGMLRFLPGHGKENVLDKKNDKTVIFKRNLNKEKEIVSEIISSIPLLEEQFDGNYEWQFADSEDALEVLDALRNNPFKPVLNWPKGEHLKIRNTFDSSDIFQKIKKEHGWFELSGEIAIDKDYVFSLKKLLALSESNSSRFLQLKNGEYLALTKQLKNELSTLHTFSQSSTGGQVKLHPLAVVAMEDSYAVNNFKESIEWIEEFKKNYEKKVILPIGLKVELRDYQIDGFQWMMRLAVSGGGALLADDMGLGKTIQAISLLCARKKEGAALVVVPASLIFNWSDEIKRFAPGLNTSILQNENREEMINTLGNGDVLIASYGLIQRNEDLFLNKEWGTLILDEAQAVKNHFAKRTKIIKKIKRKFTLITTGTPIENHLGELWNHFDIILPGFLGSAQNFKTKFQLPIEKQNNRLVRNHLRRLISPFILRRVKEEVLAELPPKTEINISVSTTKEEQSFYEAVRQQAIDRITNNTDQDSRFTVLAEITRLRQACCNPILIDKHCNIGSSKLNLFSEKVEEMINGNHQALVFSQFTSHLKLIAAHLDSVKIPYFYLDGSTPNKKRGEFVKRFQDGERPLFLISLKAGGSGLNLTNADYVFHMDPWWNPAVEDQASDRVHRIGQERPVTIYRMITSGTIEEKIIALHQEKRDLAESLLSENASALKIDTEELISIISGS